MMHRRELLNAAMAAGGASLLTAQASSADRQPTEPMKIIDTNVSLFQWPFRRLPLDEPDRLVAKVRALGISEAWAGSFEGVLHRDIAEVNRRLADTCKRFPELVPIGSINLELPAWEDDVKRCVLEFGMPGLRLHPNYHAYTLANPRFRQLLTHRLLAGRFVQIAVAMEDTRTQHPMLRVDDVDLAPLRNSMQGTRTSVQLLNHRLRGRPLDQLANIPALYFDTARVEGTDGISQFLQSVSPQKLILGTHAPFLIPEAALIRVAESNLAPETLKQLVATNADRIRRPRT